MKFGERLEAAMQEMGWGPRDLARSTGVGEATISVAVRRRSDRSNYKEVLISAFPPARISHEWLRTGAGTMTPSGVAFEEMGAVRRASYIPVVGTAKMGNDGFYEELSSATGAGDGVVAGVSKDPLAYALRVRGDSMFPSIRDGWYVIVEPGTNPSVGEYVLVKLIDGRRMVKELLHQRQDSIGVMSVNGELRQTFPSDEIDNHHGVQAIGSILPPSKWLAWTPHQVQ